jgi:hypothetical protein
VRKRRDGTRAATVELTVGKEYQFRYLIDEIRWENDNEADQQLLSAFQDAENSVVII